MFTAIWLITLAIVPIQVIILLLVAVTAPVAQAVVIVLIVHIVIPALVDIIGKIMLVYHALPVALYAQVAVVVLHVSLELLYKMDIVCVIQLVIGVIVTLISVISYALLTVFHVIILQFA